ncbi:helix-turn-helix domain-containing protein [Brevundimonas naejangsanensis]|uniref:helix-turn-helix domain-containing protein n=1 Tax=Brevundimonas naejangsanensis TaxID=588932 RepID=UPI0032089568
MMEPSQMRMARAALKISVRDLAKLSGVADSTILRFESGKGAILTTNMKRLEEALEAAGVVFLPADSTGGPGVRLRG